MGEILTNARRTDTHPGMESTRDEHAAYMERRSFGSLDGIRALSIVAVVWHHARPWSLYGGLGMRGFLGVDMFFALSGFLIVTLLLRERDASQSISLSSFYMRRTLRIFPLYYGVLLIFGLLALARPAGLLAATFWSDVPYLLTYTTNWHHPDTRVLSLTWSLSAEEQFYLVWPSLEALGRRFSWAALALFLALSQVVQLHVLDGLLSAWFGWGPLEPTMLRETSFTPILLGVLLAHVLHTRVGFERVHRLLAPRWVTPALAVALVAVLLAVPSDLSGLPRLTVHLVMIAFLAGCVVNEDHGLVFLLRSRPFVRIGVLSYGLYLLHMLADMVCERLLERFGSNVSGGPVYFVALLSASYLLAEMSFRYYEQPFLRLKSRFARTETHAQAVADSTAGTR